VNDIRDGSPLRDVRALERYELGGLVEDLALADDELMQREDVHELVVGARLLIELRVVVHQRDRVVHRLRVPRVISHRSRQG
jgi:hypothetical protein